MTDAEVVADEIEGYVTGLLGLVGIDADPLSSREHILISNLINHSWTEGRALDLMTLVGMIATPPIRKLGVFELDQFFPEADRMKLAMQLNGLLASPSFAAWAAGPPLDIDSMLFTPDGRAALRDHHDRPPLRRGASVRHLTRALEARHVDAPSVGHDRPAGDALHGRGRRLPAADGQSADQEADHAADEAGPRVRCRRRPLDAEPGRHRLQGDLERRHLDDRPAPDRPRQGASARRDVVGVPAVSTSERSATRSPGSANESSCCAGPARTSPRSSRPVGRCRTCGGR